MIDIKILLTRDTMPFLQMSAIMLLISDAVFTTPSQSNMTLTKLNSTFHGSQKTGHGESTRHTTEHNLSKSVSFYIKHVSQRATLRHTYQHLALIFAMVPVRTPFNGVRLDL